MSNHVSNKLVAHQSQTITAHPDSGASGTYLMRPTKLQEQPAPTLQVGCPNGQTMQSTMTTQLKIPNVPATSGNLLSIGQLCDNNCTAHFSKTKVIIKNTNNKVVLQGPRNERTKLWKIDVPITTPKAIHDNKPIAPSILQANGIIWKKTTKSELAIYQAHCSKQLKKDICVPFQASQKN